MCVCYPLRQAEATFLNDDFMSEHHIHAYVNHFNRYVVTFDNGKDGLVSLLYRPGYELPSQPVPWQFVYAMCESLATRPVLIMSRGGHFDPKIPTRSPPKKRKRAIRP